MAGKPQGTEARTVSVQVRITPTGAEELDKLRGSKDRSEYIRDLIAADFKSRTHHEIKIR
jgi:hypothetical protein